MSRNPSEKHTRRFRWEFAAIAAVLCVLGFALIKMLSRPGDDAQQAALPVTETTAVPTTEASAAAVTEPPTTAATEPPTTEAPTTEPIPVPDEITLDVPYYSQKGLLPTGCELVSALMVLEYYGAEVTVDDVVEHTRSEYPVTKNGRTTAPHPEEAFIGSPWDATSFGCFAPVMVDTMNQLLPEGLEAKDVTGTDLQTLAETYLPQEKPVMIWATISMLEHYPNIGWYLADEEGNPTDEWYYWQANEHCLVLVGYDETHYYLNDPYGGRGLVSYSKELVESRYNSMGQYSIIVE